MSEIPGNLEWVRDGINGMLFQTGNIRELSDKMIYCSQNKQKLQELSVNARKLIEEKADWNKNKAGINFAYRKACGL